jgi:hypothetical protein
VVFKNAVTVLKNAAAVLKNAAVVLKIATAVLNNAAVILPNASSVLQNAAPSLKLMPPLAPRARIVGMKPNVLIAALVTVFFVVGILGQAPPDERSKRTRDGETGLMGRVLDFNGAVIPHFRVVAEDDRKNRFETHTSERGEYFFALPPGRYSIVFGGEVNNLWCVREVQGYLVPKFNGYVALDMPMLTDRNFSKCRNDVIKF